LAQLTQTSEEPTMNLITGQASASANGVEFAIQGTHLPVASPAAQGNPVLLGLRPEYCV